MENHQALRITAHLFQGVAFDTRFGVGLDSLLASSIRKREKSINGISGRELDGGLARREVETVELPLAKCLVNPQLWHWQCTMGVVLNEDTEQLDEVGFIIQHTDIHALEQASLIGAYPPRISEQKGRYRARKTPIVKTLGQSVVWHAIGCPEALYGLLKDIPSIGQRRSSGEGAIREWQVEPIEHPTNPTMFSHSINSKNLSRPCSSECLDFIHAETGVLLNSIQQRAGLRPPYWHFGNTEELRIPPLKT